jgi:hypothetical protein
MTQRLKRSLSPTDATDDEQPLKRCCLLSDKFTLHRGRLLKVEKVVSTAIHKTRGVDDFWKNPVSRFRAVSTDDRNYYVAAIYTLTNNLGLLNETIYVSCLRHDTYILT